MRNLHKSLPKSLFIAILTSTGSFCLFIRPDELACSFFGVLAGPLAGPFPLELFIGTGKESGDGYSLAKIAIPVIISVVLKVTANFETIPPIRMLLVPLGHTSFNPYSPSIRRRLGSGRYTVHS